MKPIGGFFELELSFKGTGIHQHSILLNTGRNALEYILKAKRYQKLYLPYYTCDVLLEPLQRLKVEYEFYQIDADLFPLFDFTTVKSKEAFLYTNYFGINDHNVRQVAVFCNNLIIDNSQALFSEPLVDVDTFYSPRKFVGVADGAFLYTNTELSETLQRDVSFERFDHLLGRLDVGAQFVYEAFKMNDAALQRQPIKKMSALTKTLLRSIDFDTIARKRQSNFEFLHQLLHQKNAFNIQWAGSAVPMVYPFMARNKFPLKEILIQQKIFVATYWPNVADWVSKASVEGQLCTNLVALPVDQRYTEMDMKRIYEIIAQHV